MSNKNNRGKIGETNFLINFSNQENGNHDFDPSNHHDHNLLRKILMVIIAIIIIYLIGFGIYAIHHHISSKPTHHTRVTRVVHYAHKSSQQRHPKAKKQVTPVRSRENERQNLKNQRISRNGSTAKNQFNRTQDRTARTTEAPTRSTVNSQIRR